MTTIYEVDFKKKELISKFEDETEVFVEKKDTVSLEKIDVFSEYINQGMVSVTIDTSVVGVFLPPRLLDLKLPILNWSKGFNVADFAYDDAGVRGTLSFDGMPHYTDIPWHAVKKLLSSSKELRTWD